VLVAVGVAIGAQALGEGAPLLGGFVGAITALAVGEVVFIRSALLRLQAELRDLREGLSRQGHPIESPKPVQKIPEPPRDDAPALTPHGLPQPQTLQPRPTTERASPDPDPLATARSEWPAAPVRKPPAVVPETPVFRFLREYFTGGNTLVRAGVVVLFFGVAFLLRYLAEHSHLPIELRLAAIAFAAVVLLGFGWRLRARRPGYALALQGGAIGILYLTVFSALRLYALLSPTAAFALLAALSALSAILAVLQGSVAVVLLGVTGGFLAPFLASTGEGNHVALFSYFLVLNVAILGIAWFRSWRLLNLAGFAFTFLLSATWGVLQYRPQDFASTEPFLIAFFLIYVAIAVLYSIRQAPTLQGAIDGTIIFGTPIAAFGLQAAMLHDHRLALAYSALGVSGLYTALAWLLHRRRGGSQRLLVEAFMALGVAFLTLAVPLALNGRWSAASWALEGAALIWVGCRQGRRLPRAFGAALQLAAGAALGFTLLTGASLPSGTYIAGMMVGIASVHAALVLHAKRAVLSEYEGAFPAGLFLWGLLWWCVGAFSELQLHIDRSLLLAAALIFSTITAALSGEIAGRFRFQIALLPAFALLPVMLVCGLWSAASLPHPFAHGGWIAWIVAFLGLYLSARRHEDSLVTPAANTLHAAALWLLTALISWELAWGISRQVGDSGAWAAVAWAVVPLALLAVLPYLASRIRWPLGAHRDAYLVVASVGLGLYLALWSITTNVVVASPSTPLPYLPLANPLDLVQGLTLVVLARAWLRVRAEKSTVLSRVDQRPVVVGFATLGFVWLNAVLLRTLHQWAGVPYELAAMFHSTLVQAAVSIFWALLALTTMLVATRVASRILWLSGAGLLIAVVIKLFVIDLSSIGTIERIVSFVGVGLLMLVLGYFSPLPPAAAEAR
jgi:uncharacterized membrane protein